MIIQDLEVDIEPSLAKVQTVIHNLLAMHDHRHRTTIHIIHVRQEHILTIPEIIIMQPLPIEADLAMTAIVQVEELIAHLQDQLTMVHRHGAEGAHQADQASGEDLHQVEVALQVAVAQVVRRVVVALVVVAQAVAQEVQDNY